MTTHIGEKGKASAYDPMGKPHIRYAGSRTAPAANPFESLPTYDDNVRFSRYNSDYLTSSKRTHIRRRNERSDRKAHIAEVLAAIAFALLALGTVAAVNGLSTFGEYPKLDIFAQPPETALSTPASEWNRGQMPYLYQIDSAWAQEPYAGGTIQTHGCGPCALSMVYVYLTGRKNMDPISMASFSQESGYADSGSTSWLFMSEGAQKLGLKARELTSDPNAVMAQLRMGHPIICIVGPGDFTTEGHFIVLVNANDDGTVEVRDPNSEERSARSWDMKRILSQCQNLWTYSC